MQPRKTYTVKEAQKALEHYCAYQERCHQDVVKKLKGMHMIPEAIDTIVTQLIQDKYLNEERFARAFARGKFRIKQWGRLRIVRELKQRGISKYNIDNALKELPESDYLKTLNQLAAKKASVIKERNIWKKRKKLTAQLLYRGWEPHLVYETVRETVKG